MIIQTTAPQFRADAKLHAYLEEKLSRLGHVYDRIVACDVTLKLENSGRVRDKIVELRLQVPGATLVASETQRTFEAAADLIVDKMRRQLKRYKGKKSARAAVG